MRIWVFIVGVCVGLNVFTGCVVGLCGCFGLSVCRLYVFREGLCV